VRIADSSRKANRSKSRRWQLLTGSSDFSAFSSTLSIVAQFLRWSIQSIIVVSAWQSRRQRASQQISGDWGSLGTLVLIDVVRFDGSHGTHPKLLDSTLPSLG